MIAHLKIKVEQIMFYSPHQSQEIYEKEKVMEYLKK